MMPSVIPINTYIQSPRLQTAVPVLVAENPDLCVVARLPMQHS